jgi:hypothetical protein
VRLNIRAYVAYYVLAAVEFALGIWAQYTILTADRPQFPITGVMLVGLGFLFVFFGVRAQRQHRLRERLLTDGEKATAKVLRLTKTNATRNRLSQFRIRLQVTTPRHGKYEKDIKEYLTPTKANVMSPGSRVAVRVDPDDREKLIIA